MSSTVALANAQPPLGAMRGARTDGGRVFDRATPDADQAVKLSVEGLSKSYDGVVALNPIDLKVRTGELLTLLGPSGSGKTTILQLVAGLVEPSGGRIVIDGRDETDVPANQRDIGVVFQNYALFPHLTVRENIAFPLQMRRRPRAEVRQRVADVLDVVGLTDLGNRFPSELSGGQQQRVALARCMIYEPSLILMDECLSALDRKLREAMQIEIKRLHRETGATIIFVTHDQEEALALADRVCLMNAGAIEQIGAPHEVYENPRTAFVANFIGISNVFTGTVTANGLALEDGGSLPLPAGHGHPDGSAAAVSVRPERVAFCAAHEALVSGTVVETIYAGSETKLMIRTASGHDAVVRAPVSAAVPLIGDTVHLTWSGEDQRFLAG